MDELDYQAKHEGMETDFFQNVMKDEDGEFNFQGTSELSAVFKLEQSSLNDQGQSSVFLSDENQPDFSLYNTVQGSSHTDSDQGQRHAQLQDNTYVEQNRISVVTCKEEECEGGEGGGDVEMRAVVKDTGHDKSPKGKTSPKRKTRRPRTSSTSDNQTPKQDGSCQGSSPHRGEPVDVQNNSEVSFKPPLLDEILTEKKLALMRSPEVVQFLQAQQAKLSLEKKLANQSADTS